MTQNDIRSFECKVKQILDWSSLDPQTKVVLEALMAEVATLAKH